MSSHGCSGIKYNATIPEGTNDVRKSVIAAVAALVASLGMVSQATSASAAEHYVTKKEFHRVSKGMKMPRVHAIFDTRGKQVSFYSAIDAKLCSKGKIWACAEQDREYRTKSRWGYVDIDYYKRNGIWRVGSRSAYWG
jgi:hypothetical protein